MFLLACHGPGTSAGVIDVPEESDADVDADLDADADADSGDADPDSGTWDLLEEDPGPYLEGIDGCFSVMGMNVVDGSTDTVSYSIDAQFFEVLSASTTWEEGTIIDPLEGLDDCGIWATTGNGYATVGQVDWFTVDSAIATVDGASVPLEYRNGGDVENYNGHPLRDGLLPAYGSSFALVAVGGAYGDLDARGVATLPEELVLSSPSLASGETIAATTLATLAWTGTSAEVLTVLGYLSGEGTGGQGWILECEVVDDGAFDVPVEVIELLAPGMSLRLALYRGHATIVEAADGRDIYSQAYSSFLVTPLEIGVETR